MRHIRPLIAVVVVSLFGLVISYYLGNSGQSSSSGNTSVPASTPTDQNLDGKIQSQLAGQEVRCLEALEPLEIDICGVLLKDELDSVTKDAFKVTFAQHDLNADERTEIIAWESSWAGTSGGRLWVLRYKGKDLTISYSQEFGVWPPIGVQSKQNNGWFDLVAVVAGGGVKSHVVSLSHDGKTYQVTDKAVDENDVQILIRTNIEQTVFGPRPK